ncbi:B3 domain-containing transcription factor VRN1-like [Lotus japonicus]|uniref:B3 domain-containing transcription factor VRN1-like n=1 Tax=Lotus japonicus TaxID=34305 RepID=UPI0025906FB4|nr:B3 domain-containing transcription factor VRN1-like [Lotus japonicus]
MPNPVILKPPDNTSWEIHWSKHDSDIWFQKGWEEFAKYYSLYHGHLVLFEFKDASHFGVHIFDKSTLEIEYPMIYDNQDEENNNPDQMSDNSVEILYEIPSWKKTKLKSPIACPQPSKKLRTRTSKDVGRSPKLQNLSKQVQTIEGIQSHVTNLEKSTLEPVHNELEDGAGGSTECLKRDHLTSKTTKALNQARTFKSKNPSFVSVMKPAYIYRHSLHVSSQFAKNYLKKKRDIILQVLDGRTWTVSYKLGKFTAGWKKFASDNKLKVGDVCRFELNKRGSLSLKALIFPLAREPHSPQSQVQGDGANWRVQDTKSKTVTTTSRGGKATQQDSMLINPLTNGALDEANKFTSENPCFKVTIQPDRAGNYYRPHVTLTFMKKYLNKKKNVMLQFGNNLWPVKLLHSASYGAKLSKGWALFAGESKLVAGDVCVFELINKEDAVFDVHIFKGHCSYFTHVKCNE